MVGVVAVDPAGSPGGPSEPVGLTAPIVSLDFLTLSWREPENPGLSDILGYMIQWNEAGSIRCVDAAWLITLLISCFINTDRYWVVQLLMSQVVVQRVDVMTTCCTTNIHN